MGRSPLLITLMDLFLAQLTTSQWPVLFSVIAGFVGVVGVCAAWVAHSSTTRDRALIKSAESALTSMEAWEGAHTHSEHELSQWLVKRGIGIESGVADIIRACWSAWLGSRGTTLTELHVLVARRERSKMAARLSAGISTLLLVIGIVGTLSSVKPILKAFQFRISTPEGAMPVTDDPALSNVAESTELVNSLMHSLGDAFLPSLVALVATIIVVAFRGIYTLGLNRYTLELDRFAMGTVMPRYRPRSIADEYAEVRSTFSSLAKTIGEREKKFDKVVVQLAKIFDDVQPTLSGLEKGIAKMSTAADTLASKSNSIATTLTRTLGKKSPLYGAVTGFEGVFERTNELMENISVHINKITDDHEKSRGEMIETIEEISGTIENVKAGLQEDREAIDKTLDNLRSIISDLPGQAIDVVRKSFDSGIAKMQSELEKSLSEQKREVASTHEVIRDNTRTTLDLIKKNLTETSKQITDSAKAIPATLAAIETSLSDSSQKLNEATNAIPAAIERIDSTLSKAQESISAAADSIPKALKRVDESMSRKSDLEQAAVKAVHSVAEEAMSQIKNHRSDSFPDLSPSSSKVFKRSDSTPGASVSRDGESGRESPASSQVASFREPEPTKNLELSQEKLSQEGADTVFPEMPIVNDPFSGEADPPVAISAEATTKAGFIGRMFRKK